jgi:hypothetical protein
MMKTMKSSLLTKVEALHLCGTHALLNPTEIAYLIATNRIRLARLGSLRDALKAEAHPTPAWWAPAMLLAQQMRMAWQKRSARMIIRLMRAFDFDRGHVNRKEVERIFADQAQEVGRWLANDLRVPIRQLCSLVGGLSIRENRKQLRRLTTKAVKADTETAWSEWIAERSANQIELFTKNHPERILHPEITRLMNIMDGTETEKLLVNMDAIQERLLRASQQAHYWENLSSIQAGWQWNAEGVIYAQAHGVATYTIANPLDKRTCPVCAHLYGIEYSIEKTVERIIERGEMLDPGDIKENFSFPRFSDVDNIGSEELANKGFNLPPYHGRCRCQISYVGGRWSTDAVREMPALPPPNVLPPVGNIPTSLLDRKVGERVSERWISQGTHLELQTSQFPSLAEAEAWAKKDIAKEVSFGEATLEEVNATLGPLRAVSEVQSNAIPQVERLLFKETETEAGRYVASTDTLELSTSWGVGKQLPNTRQGILLEKHKGRLEELDRLIMEKELVRPKSTATGYKQWQAEKMQLHSSRLSHSQEIKRLEKTVPGRIGIDQTAIAVHDTEIGGRGLHEWGHKWHATNDAAVADEFGWTWAAHGSGLQDEKSLCRALSVSRYGQSDWAECVAENYTAYTAGEVKRMHPKMVHFFDEQFPNIAFGKKLDKARVYGREIPLLKKPRVSALQEAEGKSVASAPIPKAPPLKGISKPKAPKVPSAKKPKIGKPSTKPKPITQELPISGEATLPLATRVTELADQHGGDWEQIAQILNQEGYVNKAKKPITPTLARQRWAKANPNQPLPKKLTTKPIMVTPKALPKKVVTPIQPMGSTTPTASHSIRELSPAEQELIVLTRINQATVEGEGRIQISKLRSELDLNPHEMEKILYKYIKTRDLKFLGGGDSYVAFRDKTRGTNLIANLEKKIAKTIPKPVPKLPPKKVVTPIQPADLSIGNQIFKDNEKLAAIHDDALDEFRKMTPTKIAHAFDKGEFSDVRTFIFNSWQGDTMNVGPLVLKNRARELEGLPSDLRITNRAHEAPRFVEDMKKAQKILSPEKYARMRAATRAYLEKTVKADTITLRRGIGGETGKRYARLLRENPSEIVIPESPLTGWTDSKKVADDFGRITLVREVPIDDILIPPRLLSRWVNEEREYVVINRAKENTYDKFYVKGGPLQGKGAHPTVVPKSPPAIRETGFPTPIIKPQPKKITIPMQPAPPIQPEPLPTGPVTTGIDTKLRNSLEGNIPAGFTSKDVVIPQEFLDIGVGLEKANPGAKIILSSPSVDVEKGRVTLKAKNLLVQGGGDKPFNLVLRITDKGNIKVEDIVVKSKTKGTGRAVVEAINNALPPDRSINLGSNLSGGFWEKMFKEFPERKWTIGGKPVTTAREELEKRVLSLVEEKGAKWTEITKTLNAEGYINAAGNPLTPATVKSRWVKGAGTPVTPKTPPTIKPLPKPTPKTTIKPIQPEPKSGLEAKLNPTKKPPTMPMFEDKVLDEHFDNKLQEFRGQSLDELIEKYGVRREGFTVSERRPDREKTNLHQAIEATLGEWVKTSLKPGALAFKQRAAEVEGISGAIRSSTSAISTQKKMKKALDALSPEKYVEIRALSRAILEKKYADKISETGEMVLYRGFGGAFGKDLAKQLKTNPATLNLEESVLSGYSNNPVIAHRFGRDKGGVTFQCKVHIDDIVVVPELFSIIQEAEFVVKNSGSVVPSKAFYGKKIWTNKQ